jgi:hypothetical protein
MVQLEADLDRAVMVTVAGVRPEVTADLAAAEIRAQLHLAESAFSIRPFEPADFLILERFWLKLPGFDDEVKKLWEAEDIGDATPVDPLKRLAFRLRRTSRGLQRWSQRRVGSIRDSILVANEVILRFDAAQEHRPLSEQEQWLRRNLKLKLLGLASLERTIARQRARVAALADGDTSSQFFRIMASSRRRQSSIPRLSWGDRIAADLPGKVELATEFFLGLMGSAQPRDADISLAAVGLGQVDLSDLEAQFSEAEVWDALRAMPANKSPGPDGFTWEFYRRCWPVVKDDVLASLQSVWLGRDQGFDALNEALITLIPKTDGAVELKDFRPCVYSWGDEVCFAMNFCTSNCI